MPAGKLWTSPPTSAGQLPSSVLATLSSSQFLITLDDVRTLAALSSRLLRLPGRAQVASSTRDYDLRPCSPAASGSGPLHTVPLLGRTPQATPTQSVHGTRRVHLRLWLPRALWVVLDHARSTGRRVTYCSSDHRPQITGHRPQTADHGSQTTDHRLQTTDHRPQTINHRPHTIDYRPKTTDHRSQITDHRSQTTDHKPQTTDHRPQTTDCRPQITDHRP